MRLKMYMPPYLTLGNYLIEMVCYYMENNQHGLAPWNKRSTITNSSDKQQDLIESKSLKGTFQNPFVSGLSA